MRGNAEEIPDQVVEPEDATFELSTHVVTLLNPGSNLATSVDALPWVRAF
jgi:hypothetical protein